MRTLSTPSLLWWPTAAFVLLAFLAALLASGAASATAPPGWENATLADPPLVNATTFAANGSVLWWRTPSAPAETFHLRISCDANVTYLLFRADASGAPNLSLGGSTVDPSDPYAALYGSVDYPSWNSSAFLVAVQPDPRDARAAFGANLTISVGSYPAARLDPGDTVTLNLSGYADAGSYYWYLLNTSAVGGLDGRWSVAFKVLAQSAPFVNSTAFIECVGPPLCGRDDFPAAYDRYAIFDDGPRDAIEAAWGYVDSAGSAVTLVFPDGGEGLAFLAVIASLYPAATMSASVELTVSRTAPGSENTDDRAANATNVTSHANQLGSLVLESDLADWFAFDAPAGGLRINGSFSGSTYSDFPERVGYLKLTPELLVFNSSLGLVAAVNSEFDPHTFGCFGCRAARGSFVVDLPSSALTPGARYFAALLGRPNGDDYTSKHYAGSLNYSLSFQLPNRAPRPVPAALNVSGFEDLPAVIDLTTLFIDDDNDTLGTYVIPLSSTLPVTYNTYATNFSVTPGPNAFGTATFNVSVNDLWPGGSAWALLTVTFAPVEDPPTYILPLPTVPLPRLVWDQGGRSPSINVTSDFTDPDPEPLAYTVEVALPVLAFDCGVGCFSFGLVDDDTYGAFSATVTATDPPGRNASFSLSLQVNHVNRPPEVNASAPTNLSLIAGKGNARLNASAFCRDPDHDNLTLASLGATPAPSPFTILAAPSSAGDLLVSVANSTAEGGWSLALECRDGVGARARFDLAVVVRLADYPPTIASRDPALSDVPGLENASLSFSFTAVDPEGDPLIYWWKLDGRGLPSRTNATLITFSFTDSGFHTLEGFASDPAGHAVSTQWSVGVADVDRPPTCAIFVLEGPGGIAGTLRHLAADASDPDGDPLSYEWTQNGSFGSATDAFVVLLIKGTLNVTLTVTGHSAWSACNVTLSGTAPPDTTPPAANNTTENPPARNGFLPGFEAPLAAVAFAATALAWRTARPRKPTQ